MKLCRFFEVLSLRVLGELRAIDVPIFIEKKRFLTNFVGTMAGVHIENSSSYFAD